MVSDNIIKRAIKAVQAQVRANMMGRWVSGKRQEGRGDVIGRAWLSKCSRSVSLLDACSNRTCRVYIIGVAAAGGGGGEAGAGREATRQAQQGPQVPTNHLYSNQSSYSSTRRSGTTNTHLYSNQSSYMHSSTGPSGTNHSYMHTRHEVLEESSISRA